jgi:hypothetical protein
MANVKKTETVVEDSTAQDSMHPNTRPAGNDPKSKFEALTGMIGAMHTMRKEDCVKWFNQMMATIGKEGSGVPGGNSDSNKNSIKAKPTSATGSKDGAGTWKAPMPSLGVKEDIDEMFAGEELTEEFKEKVSTLFEAAVTARCILECEKLNEEFEVKVAEAIETATTELTEDLTGKVDTYINYVVENWMKENEVAIESSLRAELMGEFLDGLKTLFVEHYIDVPTEKVDVVEALQAKVMELEGELNESILVNAQLKDSMVDLNKKEVFDSVAEDLALSEREKFERLAEGVDFDGDLDKFASKLAVIKETYFAKKSAPAVDTNLTEETFEEDKKPTVSAEPAVRQYAEALSRLKR